MNVLLITKNIKNNTQCKFDRCKKSHAQKPNIAANGKSFLDTKSEPCGLFSNIIHASIHCTDKKNDVQRITLANDIFERKIPPADNKNDIDNLLILDTKSKPHGLLSNVAHASSHWMDKNHNIPKIALANDIAKGKTPPDKNKNDADNLLTPQETNVKFFWKEISTVMKKMACVQTVLKTKGSSKSIYW